MSACCCVFVFVFFVTKTPNRHVYFVFERTGAPRHFLVGKGYPMRKLRHGGNSLHEVLGLLLFFAACWIMNDSWTRLRNVVLSRGVSGCLLNTLFYVIHKYLRQFRYSYWWGATHMGVFKPLIMTSVYNRSGSWPCCVWKENEKPERVGTRLYAHAHERSWKLSEIGVSVITMQHMDVLHMYVHCTCTHTELKHIGNG